MKVALYTRVSTEDQAREGFSLDVQKNFLLQYARNFQGEVFCSIPNCEVYEDDGYSGSRMERPALQRLLLDARNKRFDLIIVYKQDRLSRKLKDLLSMLEEFDSLGVGYKSATEPFDTTTSAGKMAIQMLGSYAEFERNRLIERVFPGMVEGVKKGHWQGSRHVPYGYIHNKQTKKLEIHPEESKVVREIFSMYLNGKSTTQIAAYYYHLDLPSRNGGKFYTKYISDILKNKVYIGTLVWNRRRYEMKEKTRNGFGKGYKYVNNEASKILEIPNTHEPIISQKDFETVQKLLDRNRRNSVVHFKNNIYHLSGVLRCNECQGTYRGKMVLSNKRRQIKKPWYYCSSQGASYIKCHNKAIPAGEVSEKVWEIVGVICQNIHLIEELGDLIKLTATDPEECYGEELTKLDAALHKNIGQQKVLYEIFTEDKINIDLYKEKADLLRVQEKQLKTNIKATQLKILEKRNSINIVKEAEEFLKGLNKEQPTDEHMDYSVKTFMRIIFKNIYIQDREIVKFELNQPWKLCYEEGLKCKNKTRENKKEGKSRQEEIVLVESENSPSYWRPTAGRWVQYCTTLVGFLEKIHS